MQIIEKLTRIASSCDVTLVVLVGIQEVNAASGQSSWVDLTCWPSQIYVFIVEQ